MMKLLLLVTLLGLVTVHAQSLESQIKQANTIWMSNFAAGNGSAVGECYSPDAKLLPTGSEVITGRDGIGSFFTGAMSSGVSTVLLQTDEVNYLDTSSQWAYERGHYTFYNNQGAQIDYGKYVVVWTQIGGAWYLYNDIFNSNTAPKSMANPRGMIRKHPRVKLQGVPDGIAQANQVWMDNFKTGNGSLVAQCYAINANLLPTGTDVLTGQPAIGSFFQGAMSSGVASVQLVTDEVGPSDATTWAFERGHYKFYNKQGTQIDYGKYVVVWINFLGNWYLYNDIFNTNTPPQNELN